MKQPHSSTFEASPPTTGPNHHTQKQTWLNEWGSAEQEEIRSGINLCTFIPNLVYQRQRNSESGEKTNIHIHIDGIYLAESVASALGLVLDHLLILYFSQKTDDTFSGKLAIRMLRQENTEHYQLEVRHNKDFGGVLDVSEPGNITDMQLLLETIEGLDGRIKITCSVCSGTLVSITFYNFLQHVSL